jgi:hypothetical protein
MVGDRALDVTLNDEVFVGRQLAFEYQGGADH